jgi:hypothetical protein
MLARGSGAEVEAEMAQAALVVSMDPETVHWIIKARHLPSRGCPPDFGPESDHTKRAYVQVTAIESRVSRCHGRTAPEYSPLFA